MINPKEMAPLLEAVIRADSILASPMMDNSQRGKALDVIMGAVGVLGVKRILKLRNQLRNQKEEE